MKLEEFNYELPKELIAQFPIEKRDESRLLVLDRVTRTIEHKSFKDIFHYIMYFFRIHCIIIITMRKLRLINL